MEKPKSIINDPDHIPQKKGKVIKELPHGRFIPKEMQKMSGRGWVEVRDDSTHNHIVSAINKEDEKGGAFLSHEDIELYLIGNCIIIYEGISDRIFSTKESPIVELTPEYWDNLIKQ